MSDEPGRLLVVRHGETEWSRTGRHTGRTDIALTEAGERAARALAPHLEPWKGALVLCSPLRRARRTAELAGLTVTLDDDLVEWDYGAYEGRTRAEIVATSQDPDWSVWTTTTGLGEPLTNVGARAARVLDRCRPVLATGRDVVLVAHGHLLRVLTATWLELPLAAGERFPLEPAATGLLGHDRGTAVLLRWNG